MQGLKLKGCLESYADATEEQDPNSMIDANMNQLAAMMHHWCTAFGLDPDFTRRLDMTQERTMMYTMMAVPLAVSTIEKGQKLTNEEANQVLTQNTCQQQRF